MDKRILLVQDQHALASWRHDLEHDGFQVSTLDWGHALKDGPRLAPSLVLVDIAVPVINCIPVCEELYDQCQAPVLVFLNRGQVPPDGTSLAFMTRPVASPRLLGQVHALLGEQAASRYLCIGDLCLDLESRVLTKGDQQYDLSPKLFALLRMFLTHPGQVLSRKQLMKEVWDTDYLGDTRTLYVHIRWLRKMIEIDPASPTYLRTIRGIGYHFDYPA